MWENYVTTVSPNFSQFGPGAADLEFKMHVQLAYFLRSKNRENIISAASKSNEIILGIITPQETPQRNQFALTMGLWQLNMEQAQTAAKAADNSPEYTAFCTCEATTLRLVNAKLSFDLP